MALSIVNYFLWDIPDARVPFIIADIVVIVALYYVDRGMKAEKALREMQAEKEHLSNEISKDSKRAQKAAVRDEQKRKIKNQKYNGGAASKKSSHSIQQPNKSKGS